MWIRGLDIGHRRVSLQLATSQLSKSGDLGQLAISGLRAEEVFALSRRYVEQPFALSAFSHLGMSLRRRTLSLLTAFTILTAHLSVFQPRADSALWRYNGILPLSITSVDA